MYSKTRWPCLVFSQPFCTWGWLGTTQGQASPTPGQVCAMEEPALAGQRSPRGQGIWFKEENWSEQFGEVRCLKHEKKQHSWVAEVLSFMVLMCQCLSWGWQIQGNGFKGREPVWAAPAHRHAAQGAASGWACAAAPLSQELGRRPLRVMGPPAAPDRSAPEKGTRTPVSSALPQNWPILQLLKGLRA